MSHPSIAKPSSTRCESIRRAKAHSLSSSQPHGGPASSVMTSIFSPEQSVITAATERNMSKPIRLPRSTERGCLHSANRLFGRISAKALPGIRLSGRFPYAAACPVSQENWARRHLEWPRTMYLARHTIGLFQLATLPRRSRPGTSGTRSLHVLHNARGSYVSVRTASDQSNSPSPDTRPGSDAGDPPARR